MLGIVCNEHKSLVDNTLHKVYYRTLRDTASKSEAVLLSDYEALRGTVPPKGDGGGYTDTIPSQVLYIFKNG